ncbi:MAG: hypothetical protein M3186_05655 [Actinomycetota bacterium]|nr:hypothetical protein [Actinomycetota bacterium]
MHGKSSETAGIAPCALQRCGRSSGQEQIPHHLASDSEEHSRRDGVGGEGAALAIELGLVAEELPDHSRHGLVGPVALAADLLSSSAAATRQHAISDSPSTVTDSHSL